jgi:hypothetical protein
MGRRAAAGAACIAALLAGCDVRPRPVDPGAPPPRMRADPPVIEGAFRPISALARARTGAVSVSGLTLTFDRAPLLLTDPLETAAAEDIAAVGGPSYADLLLLREPGDVAEIRSVRSEQQDRESLCAPDRAKWLALGLSRTPSGERHLAIALFTGEQAPSGGAAAVRLCGVFRYLAG